MNILKPQKRLFKELRNVNDLLQEIKGISISLEDVKEMLINKFQAIDLLYLLSVKVKE